MLVRHPVRTQMETGASKKNTPGTLSLAPGETRSRTVLRLTFIKQVACRERMCDAKNWVSPR